MRPSEAEIKDVIRDMLTSIKKIQRKASAHKPRFQKSSLYEQSLNSVAKLCNKALQTEGPELRELCLYILGNAIYWDGNETKEKLRRFSFHGAASYRKAIFKQEIADLMKDEEAQVDSRMM